MKASKQLKKLHKKSENSKMSFKQFLRSVKDTEGELLKVYFDNRKGKLNKSRSDKNNSRILLEKQATKSAKTKTKKEFMKNGSYIENYKNYKNALINYKNNEIVYVEYCNGDKFWHKTNKLLHRLDGPARINKFGTKYWYLDGVRINVRSQKEFIRYLNTIAFR